MRRTALALFALAFMAYMLWTTPMNSDRQASLEPLLPSVMHLLPNLASKPSARAPANTAKPGEDGGALAMKKWLIRESEKVGRIDQHPTATVVRLKQKALSLTRPDLEFLKTVAVSPEGAADERFLAVYMIGLSESAAAKDQLREISQSPVPPTANDRAYSDEIVIRAHAMESLVRRQNPREAARYLTDFLAKTSDASLARQARYWLSKL